MGTVANAVIEQQASPKQTISAKPRAETFTVERLMEEVAQGRLRIPSFQRTLRWENDDRKQLFDSVYRGFPIGALLLWKRPASKELVRFHDVEIDAPAQGEALWIVDGQQRIATLVSALLRKTPLSGSVLHFDLQRHEFVYRSAATFEEIC